MSAFAWSERGADECIVHSVELDARIEAALEAAGAQRGDLEKYLWRKRLPARAGIDHHHVIDIDRMEDMLATPRRHEVEVKLVGAGTAKRRVIAVPLAG